MSYVLVSGNRPLRGRCGIQGSKNVALHLYAGALLMPGRIVIRNAPNILDTFVCAELISDLGRPTSYQDGSFVVGEETTPDWQISPEHGQRIRPTACFAAALLSRSGRARFPTPGGDGFCERPIDLHLRAMELAGATLTRYPDGTVGAVLRQERPVAFTMSLDSRYGPSLGATITAIFLAALARGTSVLTDVSIEPEVLHTVDQLNRAGASIAMQPGRRCEIHGVSGLRPADSVVPSDRLEAGTLALAALITGGEVALDNAGLSDLTPGFVETMQLIGGDLVECPTGLLVRAPRGLVAADVVTGPHPEFPTDLQPQTVSLLTRAPGRSTVVERVYRRRATHVAGLRAFGAVLDERGDVLVVNGGGQLRPADVTATDIRCCTALLLAALAAPGESRISGLYHLDRGHGRLLDVLSDLGASIVRLDPVHELVTT
jgi:UDP-N-acetylglucosamine 1-carboxyvinyltransferase